MINYNEHSMSIGLTDEQISSAYSYLGYKCISAGDIEALKALYGVSCFEEPPVIETISLLQHRLTAIAVLDDTQNKYSDEFIYYWGMVCIGEVSRLIARHLETATACFEKIKKTVPKARARLAFIELLKTTDPHKSDNNSRRVAVLQKWAGCQDIFSRIALSKIIYDSYLREEHQDRSELPTLAIQLLDRPCKMRHPVAVRFYHEMIDNMNGAGVPYGSGRKLSIASVNIDTLYDF